MITSKRGIELIKRWESFSPEPYQDSVGVWTIGYGTTRGINSSSERITIDRAVELLKEDVMSFENEIHALGLSLRQCQFDAVVSFCYNLGTPNFKSSGAYKLMRINPNDKGIADSWLTWRNAGGKYLRGLMRRRLEELSLYYSW